LKGCGWYPYYVEGDDALKMHELMASTMDIVIERINKIQEKARINGEEKRQLWPMIVLRTPKGWTGPKEVDNNKVEGSFRSHQVPILVDDKHVDNLKVLENWLKSYHPEELFDEDGKLKPELKNFAPKGLKRMGSNPHANGGLLLKELRLPDFRDYSVKMDKPGSVLKQDMMELGSFIRDIIKLNDSNSNFRIFGPDEALSNRLNHMFEDTNRQWLLPTNSNDEFLARSGRVMDSMLSEHLCEGVLEGYLLTGRHGFFHSYEAFIRIVDSMTSQHAKWLKVVKKIPWRRSISSLNYVLTSHIWQQDHNGYTHQDPGFLNHLATKKADITRIYLPPDTNCLLSCFNHCITTKDYINVIIASKHPRPQWLNIDDAIIHCTKGLGIWKWASNDNGKETDIVMACAGDTPTLETLAATKILRENFPELKIRVVNVVDLMKLESNLHHPHGLTNNEYNEIFTKDKPIIFAFHGYPSLIRQLIYTRENKNIDIHGYQEEGTITTPFDMRVQNEIDRFHLVMSALNKLPQLGNRRSTLYQECMDKLIKHKEYIKEYGQDMEEVRNWTWE
jgi:xylulose-5-phosphate/fructose-6-phosphate phosphoketolase